MLKWASIPAGRIPETWARKSLAQVQPMDSPSYLKYQDYAISTKNSSSCEVPWPGLIRQAKDAADGRARQTELHRTFEVLDIWNLLSILWSLYVVLAVLGRPT